MKWFLSGIFSLFFYNLGLAQFLFSQHIPKCQPPTFCLDCGDVQASFDEEKFNQAKSYIENNQKFKGLEGGILFQIILNTKGRGCVISHSDESNGDVTKEIIKVLNDFDGWIQPVYNEKKEEYNSFNFLVTITPDGKIQGKIDRVDMNAFKAAFDHPRDPEIDNKHYSYKNEHLNKYTFKIWNTKNSGNPNNMNDDVTIALNGDVWFTLDEGLFKFDGKNFIDSRQNITNTGKYFTYYTVAADKSGKTWAATTEGLYSYENGLWQKHDSANIGFKDVDKIVINKSSNEVFFCTDLGLFIFNNNSWKVINSANTPQLPTNRICFAKRDSKNRIWIGTYKGSIMIDNENVISFNKTSFVLKNKSIISLDENNEGDVFMGTYDYRKNSSEKSNDGIVVFTAKEKHWKQFTVSNSGLPVNNTEDLIIDDDGVVWIVTSTAGLVRFDYRSDVWENYNNTNSEIPTSFISDITMAMNGDIFLGTRQGLVLIKKK